MVDQTYRGLVACWSTKRDHSA